MSAFIVNALYFVCISTSEFWSYVILSHNCLVTAVLCAAFDLYDVLEQLTRALLMSTVLPLM